MMETPKTRLVTLEEAQVINSTSGMPAFDLALHLPVRRGDLVDRQALDRQFAQTTGNILTSASTEVLHQVRRAQQIDAHNAAIDEAKAKKRQLRAIAKQARIPVEAVKRMVKSVQRAS